MTSAVDTIRRAWSRVARPSLAQREQLLPRPDTDASAANCLARKFVKLRSTPLLSLLPPRSPLAVPLAHGELSSSSFPGRTAFPHSPCLIARRASVVRGLPPLVCAANTRSPLSRLSPSRMASSPSPATHSRRSVCSGARQSTTTTLINILVPPASLGWPMRGSTRRRYHGRTPGA